ncbi:hypothetical protein ACFX10_028586 [Malus domestica]
MGKGSECSINKRCYDITMSRRTRKSSFNYNVQEGISIPTPAPALALKKFLDENGDGGDQSSPSPSPSPSKVENEDHPENGYDRKILKQLINGDERARAVIKLGNEGSTGRSSLGQHFTEEEKGKNLQLVKKQQRAEESLQGGMKLKKLVSRCAKVFGHLVIVRSDRTLREPRKLEAAVPKLTM